MDSRENSSGAALAPVLSKESGNVRRVRTGVLPCLVLAESEHRRRLIRAAAEAQAWDAILCCDIGEFLRCVFRRRVPLIIVDIPPNGVGSDGAAAPGAEMFRNEGLTPAIREATETAVRSQEALLLVCGQAANQEHEIWSRSIGAWSYLSEAKLQVGFEFVLQQAREAIGRQEKRRHERQQPTAVNVSHGNSARGAYSFG